MLGASTETTNFIPCAGTPSRALRADESGLALWTHLTASGTRPDSTAQTKDRTVWFGELRLTWPKELAARRQPSPIRESFIIVSSRDNDIDDELSLRIRPLVHKTFPPLRAQGSRFLERADLHPNTPQHQTPVLAARPTLGVHDPARRILKINRMIVVAVLDHLVEPMLRQQRVNLDP